MNRSDLDNIQQEINSFVIEGSDSLEAFRIQFLVKKGVIARLFDEFKELDTEDKKKFGKSLNILKQGAQDKYIQYKEQFSTDLAKKEVIDKSLPGYPFHRGSKHPVSIVNDRICSILEKIGFTVSEGPEVEDDWHNFSALNFPENHPARDMQDTFFAEEGFALRTHTSSIQVRVMENQQPPIRTICPGRVYRNEAISSRSNCFFHQIEGLYIDRNVSMVDLKQTLFMFVQEFFGKGTKVRFRPSYFPFTEPSAEMDIYLGSETEEDRRLTKGTGWLEILGCGMVDPQVLKNCGIDPEEYSGYAFGLGIDRIAMIQFGIKDIRQMFENDIRFLQQFDAIS